METPAGDLTTNTWDYEKLAVQTELPDDSIVTFTYNSDLVKVERDDGAVVERYLNDRHNVLVESDDGDVTQVVNTYQPQPYGNLLSRRDATALESDFYHYDALGSTAALTDGSAVETDTYRYDAWGNDVAGSGTSTQPYKYVGQQGYRWDAGLSLYDARRRRYRPTTGRFLSQDPARDDESNLYRYVGNNPANATDPSGMLRYNVQPFSNGKTIWSWWNAYEWGELRAGKTYYTLADPQLFYQGDEGHYTCDKNLRFQELVGSLRFYTPDKDTQEVYRGVPTSGSPIGTLATIKAIKAEILKSDGAFDTLNRKRGRRRPAHEVKHRIDRWFAEQSGIDPDSIPNIQKSTSVWDVIFGAVSKALKALVTRACAQMERFGGSGAAGFCELMNKIVDLITTVFRDPKQFFNTLLDGLKIGFTGFINDLPKLLRTKVLSTFLEAVVPTGVTLPNPPSGTAADLTRYILELLGATWENIESILKSELGAETVAKLKGFFDSVTQCKNSSASILDTLKCILTPYVKNVQSQIDEIAKQLDLDALLTEFGAKFVQTAKSVVLNKALKELAKFAAGGVLNIIVKIFNLLKWLFNNGEKVKEAVSKVIGAINKAAGAIKAGNAAVLGQAVKQGLGEVLVAATRFAVAIFRLDKLGQAIWAPIKKIKEAVPKALRTFVRWFIRNVLCRIPGIANLIPRCRKPCKKPAANPYGEIQEIPFVDNQGNKQTAKVGKSVSICLKSPITAGKIFKDAVSDGWGWWHRLIEFPFLGSGAIEKGHILGRQLSGAGDNEWANLTPLFRKANDPAMRTCEGFIRRLVEATKCGDVNLVFTVEGYGANTTAGLPTGAKPVFPARVRMTWSTTDGTAADEFVIENVPTVTTPSQCRVANLPPCAK